jgi:hypothetical protein
MSVMFYARILGEKKRKFIVKHEQSALEMRVLKHYKQCEMKIKKDEKYRWKEKLLKDNENKKQNSEIYANLEIKTDIMRKKNLSHQKKEKDAMQNVSKLYRISSFKENDSKSFQTWSRQICLRNITE